MEIKVYNINIKPTFIDDKSIRQNTFTNLRRFSRASKASVTPNSDIYCPPYEREFFQVWDKYIMKEDFDYFSIRAPKYLLEIPVVLADSNPFLSGENMTANAYYCIIVAALNAIIELQKSVMNDYRFSHKISAITLNNDLHHEDISLYPFIYKEHLYPSFLKEKMEVHVLELDVSIYRHLIMCIQKEFVKEFWLKAYHIVNKLTPTLLNLSPEHLKYNLLFSHKKKEEHFEVRKNIFRLISEQNVSPKRLNMSYDFLLNKELNNTN